MSNVDDLLREKFNELCGQRDAITAQTAPLRDQRDAIMAQARDIELTAQPLNDQLRDLEGPLFDLNNEIAKIARALRPAGSLVSNTASET